MLVVTKENKMQMDSKRNKINKKIVIDGKNVEFDGLKFGGSIDVKNYINGYSQEDGQKIAQDINRQLGKLYKG